MEKDPLTLETRRRIFQFIRERPGTYMREMERELQMQPGVLQYHLRVLEEMRLITAEGDGFRRRYFVSSEIPLRERKILSMLKLETPRRILMYLLQHPQSSFEELRGQFGFSKSALTFQMKRLMAAGLISAEKQKQGTVYSVVNPEEVARVLITYRVTFLDRLVDSFVDSWLRLS
jgi:predicted transcriptional regulator